ncbi:MAG: helix-turn-helix transcriptional regulator [Firmicutes bacterium]|nr:helix-turn-helix transcriptional regulator [Bacillota bacterium]
MKTMLAENIRRFRKERSLTQEQLSEVLGVTAGAVYKWEAGLSVPDLDLIVEMADFFDISVDVLIGYKTKDNRLEATVRRLQEYRRQKDMTGLSEAEKALKKYPHSFQIVNESATLYRAFGIETGDKALYLRALELLEQAHLLVAQNTDPEVSEQTLYGKTAEVYLGLGEWEEAVELFKKHNAGGLYDHVIGQTLAINGRTEEAMPYLSESLARILGNLASTVTGYLNAYAAKEDYASLQAIVKWVIDLYSGLREGDKPFYFDKLNCGLLAVLAFAQYKTGQETEAQDSLRRANELAQFFDADPSYDESDIRFIDRIQGASVHDDIGPTALDTIDNVIDGWEDDEFIAIWNDIKRQDD